MSFPSQPKIAIMTGINTTVPVRTKADGGIMGIVLLQTLMAFTFMVMGALVRMVFSGSHGKVEFIQ